MIQRISFPLLVSIAYLCFPVLNTISASEINAKDGARRAPEWNLEDFRGKKVSSSEYNGKPVTVVAFLGVECPLAKIYSIRLGELLKKYEKQQLKVIGIDSNIQDSLAEIASFAQKQAIEFPLLKDPDATIAAKFGATRTPEVFVIDSQGMICYSGRIDDQYGIGYTKPEPTVKDLQEAVECVLNNKPIIVKQTSAPGCRIAPPREKSPSGTVTYSRDVAPLLQKYCVQCHRDGEIGPMSLTSYDDVAGWADMIQEVIDEGRMPPWHANPQHGHFINDRSMTSGDKETIRKWISIGIPEGNRGDLPPASQYTQGWQLSKEPDLIVKMNDQPFIVPAEGTVPYKYFIVDPNFTEDKWVSEYEIQPGNRAVVHHILLFAKETNSKRELHGERGYLAGYVPGSRSRPYPAGMAKKIPAGSKLVFQVHYTPIGTEQTDTSHVGFVFADPSKITHVVETTSAVQLSLNIPPNEQNYETSALLPEELPNCQLLSMSPHMHVRGKAFRYEAIYPDKQREILLDVPRYDFNWQTAYALKEMKSLPKGTRIYCTAAFDNSAKNLNNPDPNKQVRWGDQTSDEMMIGYFDIAVPIQDASRTPSRKMIRERIATLLTEQVFNRWDKNEDNLLTRDEFPARWVQYYDTIDENQDGKIERSETRRE